MSTCGEPVGLLGLGGFIGKLYQMQRIVLLERDFRLFILSLSLSVDVGGV